MNKLTKLGFGDKKKRGVMTSHHFTILWDGLAKQKVKKDGRSIALVLSRGWKEGGGGGRGLGGRRGQGREKDRVRHNTKTCAIQKHHDEQKQATHN